MALALALTAWMTCRADAGSCVSPVSRTIRASSTHCSPGSIPVPVAGRRQHRLPTRGRPSYQFGTQRIVVPAVHETAHDGSGTFTDVDARQGDREDGEFCRRLPVSVSAAMAIASVSVGVVEQQSQQRGGGVDERCCEWLGR